MNILRLLKRSVILLIVCLASSSCNEGPEVTVCVSDVQAGGFDCVNSVTKITSFIAYGDSDKYVAFNPTDAQSLLTYCAEPSSSPSSK
jgi:hypothetical protein